MSCLLDECHYEVHLSLTNLPDTFIPISCPFNIHIYINGHPMTTLLDPNWTFTQGEENHDQSKNWIYSGEFA